MREIDRIADQLRKSLHGPAWHGPALLELISELDFRQALARPLPEAHSIWKIVLHVTSWISATAQALEGQPMPSDDFADDWPAVREQSAAGWQMAVQELEEKGEQLAALVSLLSEERLEEQVLGRNYSFYFLLHGIAQHNIYHAGQIALLKKGLEQPKSGNQPARRTSVSGS